MKNKIFLFLLPLLAVTWLVSCHKDSPSPGAAGVVKEFGTDTPIPDATVYGIDCEGEPLGPITCFATDMTHTDAEGHYSLPEEPGWVLAEASSYWKADQVPVLYEKELVTNVSLYPFAWLKVTLRNESGAYLFSGPTGSYPDLPERGFVLPQDSDTTIVCFTKGNIDFKYVFGIFLQPNEPSLKDLSGVVITKSDGAQITPVSTDAASIFTIYLPGHDTTNLFITY